MPVLVAGLGALLSVFLLSAVDTDVCFIRVFLVFGVGVVGRERVRAEIVVVLHLGRRVSQQLRAQTAQNTIFHHVEIVVLDCRKCLVQGGDFLLHDNPVVHRRRDFRVDVHSGGRDLPGADRWLGGDSTSGVRAHVCAERPGRAGQKRGGRRRNGAPAGRWERDTGD